MDHQKYVKEVGRLAVNLLEAVEGASSRKNRKLLFQTVLDAAIQYRKRRMQRWVAEKYGTDVQSGPFRGMKYLGIDDFDPGFFYAPKILGTLEQDLAKYLKDLSGYDQVINVGCAEGYYAVGPLVAFSHLNVFAFDISAEERELCARTAALNRVQDRLTIDGECTVRFLEENCSERTLVIMDIEGSEIGLLTACNAEKLRSDFIIECHPVDGNSSEGRVREYLEATHETLTIQQTFPDISQIPDLASWRQLDRFFAIWEGRGPWPWVWARYRKTV